MSEFVRVKSKKGPAAEYLVHQSVYEKHKDRYTLVKPKKPATSTAVKRPATRTKPPAARRQAPKSSKPEEA